MEPDATFVAVSAFTEGGAEEGQTTFSCWNESESARPMPQSGRAVFLRQRFD